MRALQNSPGKQSEQLRGHGAASGSTGQEGESLIRGKTLRVTFTCHGKPSSAPETFPSPGFLPLVSFPLFPSPCFHSPCFLPLVSPFCRHTSTPRGVRPSTASRTFPHYPTRPLREDDMGTSSQKEIPIYGASDTTEGGIRALEPSAHQPASTN
ncbi:hypothetical protein EYF80_063711 [Liparis tanakae]|uniref:Uncharacterized protein n=1 Tax=Liparis tanakae TaxID=230148 RepID=A0A4Z2ECX8_9TELE|nr:hypothetical protein EYF80_063711 [Liparis tanakae]